MNKQDQERLGRIRLRVTREGSWGGDLDMPFLLECINAALAEIERMRPVVDEVAEWADASFENKPAEEALLKALHTYEGHNE